MPPDELTDKRDEPFLFVIGEFVTAAAFRYSAAVVGGVAVAETAFEMLLPKMAEPRVAAIKDATVFHHVPVVLILAVNSGSQSVVTSAARRRSVTLATTAATCSRISQIASAVVGRAGQAGADLGRLRPQSLEIGVEACQNTSIRLINKIPIGDIQYHTINHDSYWRGERNRFFNWRLNLARLERVLNI